MAETRKILGQAALPSTVLTDVYTVPALSQAVISTIVVTNRSAIPSSFRVSVVVGGAVDDPKQYIYYDVYIPSYETFAATIGITLNAGDVVRGYATTANLSINLFGVEII